MADLAQTTLTLVKVDDGISPVVTKSGDTVTITDAEGRQVQISDGADGKSPTVMKSGNTVYITDADGVTVEVKDGAQGQSIKGDDGEDAWFHIAWADYYDPDTGNVTGFSVLDATDKDYMGTYTDHTEDDSTNPSDYKWVKVKGEPGPEATVSIGSVNVNYEVGDAWLTATLFVSGVETTPLSYKWTRGVDTTVIGTAKSLYSPDLDGIYHCTVEWRGNHGIKYSQTGSLDLHAACVAGYLAYNTSKNVDKINDELANKADTEDVKKLTLIVAEQERTAQGFEQTVREFYADIVDKTSSQLYYDIIEYPLSEDKTQLTAAVWQYGENIAQNFPPSMFGWIGKSEDGDIPLGTGYSIVVSRDFSTYGGEVEGVFYYKEIMALITPDKKYMITPDGKRLTVQM